MFLRLNNYSFSVVWKNEASAKQISYDDYSIFRLLIKFILFLIVLNFFLQNNHKELLIKVVNQTS